MISRTGRKLGMLVVGLATVAGAALMAGPSATAVAAAEECGAGEFCMYENGDGTGAIQRVVNQTEGACLRATMFLPGGSLHQARKIVNNTAARAAGFKSNDCTGELTGIVTSTGADNPDGGPRSYRLFDCENGKVCAWEGRGFAGTKTARDWADSCAPTRVDALTVWNRSSKGIGLYASVFCVGSAWKGDLASGSYTFPNEPIIKISRV